VAYALIMTTRPQTLYGLADSPADLAAFTLWISPEVPVRGFVYDVHTGRLSEVFPDRETVTG